MGHLAPDSSDNTQRKGKMKHGQNEMHSEEAVYIQSKKIL